jgi:hypothetical protein
MSKFKSYTTNWGSKVAILLTKAGSIVAESSDNAEKLTFGEYADATHEDVRNALDAGTAEIYLALMGQEPITVEATEPTPVVTPIVPEVKSEVEAKVETPVTAPTADEAPATDEVKTDPVPATNETEPTPAVEPKEKPLSRMNRAELVAKLLEVNPHFPAIEDATNAEIKKEIEQALESNK